MDANDELSDLVLTMQPFPAHSLGWFCLGYHMSAVLGRGACIAELLLRSQTVPAELCTATKVRPVLAKLLSLHPNWVTIHPSNVATVAVNSSRSLSSQSLAQCVQEWVAVEVKECCGKACVRWRLLPARFFTLAAGLTHGQVVCVRCYTCSSVYAGCWKWPRVPENSHFPDGFHSPVFTSSSCLQRRWFFATPQVIFEVKLLSYVLGLLARGGISFTAFAIVYTGIWSSSMQNTMYMARTHFLIKLEIVIIVYASVMMFADSGVGLEEFVWHLQPHHVANDFGPLLVLVRKAFYVVGRTCLLAVSSRSSFDS